MEEVISRTTSVMIVLLAFVYSSPTVLAHHSAVAFDPNSSLQITGEVTQFIWRSPHLSINMDVKNDDGTNVLWKIEGQGIATMVAAGFDRNVVSEGDEITVRVHPMRNGEPGGLLQGLISADGVAYSMDGPETPEQQRQVIPSLTAYVPPPPGETWQERERKTRPDRLPIISDGLGTGDSTSTGRVSGALDPSNLQKEQQNPSFDLTGVWQYRGEDQWRENYGSYEFKPEPQFTAKGQAFYDAYQEAAVKGDRFRDPTAFCYPAGMPRMMTRYGSLMMLQYSTAIFMISRLNNEYRVIYLDGRPRVPDNYLDRNWGGESLAHWEGDVLVVETEGFTDENHMMQAGVVTGSQLKIIERIQILNDGNTLMTEYMFVDPEHWVGEWKHTKFRDRVLRSDVKEANCLYQDNLALPGLGN